VPLAPPDYTMLPTSSKGSRSSSQHSNLRIGVVRVATPELDIPAYLSEQLDANGRVTLTRDIGEALQVCFAPSKHPHNIHIPRVITRGGNRPAQFPLLGVTHNPGNGWYAITCTSPAVGTSTSQPTSYAWANETKSAVWMMSSDNTISITYHKTGLTPMLTLEFTPHHVDPARIGLVVDVNDYRRKHGLADHTYNDCRLVFQSL